MNFSRCGEACPARASDFSGIVFTPCFKRNERRLTSKKPKWKRWKMSIKNVHGNLRSVVTSLYFCIGAYWLRINMNNSFSMELASQEPILPLLMKKLDGNNFYNLKLRLLRKCLRNRWVVSGLFLAHAAANLRMCACLLNSLLNRNLLFSWINSDVNNLRNRNINHWKENFCQ